MLVTLKEIMKIAEEKGIAIGAFNAANFESLEAGISAAQELQLPVIMQFAQCHETWIGIDLIGPAMLALAKKADVPVCVHLDHGETLDYLAHALELGFTSIMYDGSTLPYESNLMNTKKAVAMAARAGASVEAELGTMGKTENGTGTAAGEAKIYTDPELAAAFVRETGIDALACSFGTTHGIYLTSPQLDFEIVKSVREKTGNIPVVMHGGSGVGREDFHNAIRAGVRKINYFTYMDRAGGDAAVRFAGKLPKGQPAFFSAVSMAARDAMREDIKAAMKTFAFMDECAF